MDSDYKNDNEAASGLVGMTKKVGRVLMSPVEAWNNKSYEEKKDLENKAFGSVALIGMVSVAGIFGMAAWTGIQNEAKKDAAIDQMMDNIIAEQVVDDGYGQYSAKDMSPEALAVIRVQAEKLVEDALATEDWNEVCYDGMLYIERKEGVGRNATLAMTAKIDSDTLKPERCEVETPKMQF